MNALSFRHVPDDTGNDIYTLFPEKRFEGGWVVGWCPELERTMLVHPANVVGEDNEE
jgi:hypothetical protein